MQPVAGNQRPGLLTSLMHMSLVLLLPRKIHLCRSSSNAPRLPSLLEMLQNPHVLLTLDKVHNPLRPPRETTSERQKVVRAFGVFSFLTSKCASRHNGVRFFLTSQLPKVVRTWCALYILTSTCASRRNGVPFFHISTSRPGVLCTFLNWKCASRHNGVHFRHLNFQKCSEPGVFCTFWLRNALRATTACTFSTSQLPKVPQT